MFVFTYAAAFLAVIYATAALTLFFHSSPTPLSRLLACYLFSSAVWAGSNAAADVAYTVEAGQLLGGIAFVAIGLNLICFLVLIEILIKERFPSWKRLVVFSIPNIAPSLFSFSSLGIKEVIIVPGSPAQIIPGVLYYFGLFLICADLAYGLSRLIQSATEAR